MGNDKFIKVVFAAKYIPWLTDVAGDPHGIARIMFEPHPEGGVIAVAARAGAILIIHDKDGMASGPARLTGAADTPEFVAACRPATIRVATEDHEHFDHELPPEWQPHKVECFRDLEPPKTGVICVTMGADIDEEGRPEATRGLGRYVTSQSYGNPTLLFEAEDKILPWRETANNFRAGGEPWPMKFDTRYLAMLSHEASMLPCGPMLIEPGHLENHDAAAFGWCIRVTWERFPEATPTAMPSKSSRARLMSWTSLTCGTFGYCQRLSCLRGAPPPPPRPESGQRGA